MTLINIIPLKVYAQQWQAVSSLQNSGFLFFLFYMFGVDGRASEMDARGAEAHGVGTHPLHGFVTWTQSEAALLV